MVENVCVFVFSVWRCPTNLSPCPRFLCSDCEILDERFRTCSYISNDIPSNVDFVQDLDGNGEIGIEEVSGSPIVHNMKLIHHAQFKPLWDYVKVSCHSCNSFPSLSTRGCSNGEKCSNPSTITKTVS